MKTIYFFLAVLLLASCAADNKTSESYNFYVGTYTDGESKGIYQYVLKADGSVEKVKLLAESNNPSFLAKSKDGKCLVAVNEVNDVDDMGTVESYSITADSLLFISRNSSGGAHPCFVTTNNSGYVLTANYTGGNVGLLQLNDKGELSDLLFVQQHEGKGTTDRQEGPHAHSAWFASETDVIAVDLGANELWLSQLDTETNQLSTPQKIAMAPGAGPRHLTFHPNKEIIYVLNELNGTVTWLQKGENGYTISGTITTLPEDFTEFNKCADIHVSSDGKFLYASNRGHNSIVIYELDEKGTPTLVGFESTRGDGPRNFSLSPDETFLLVANQHTNNIVSYKRDAKTGLLTFVAETAAPSPVCILF